MKKFMMAALGPGADEEKIADYCDGSVEHYNWLVECGVPFKASFWGEPGWEPPFDDGLMYSGGENAAPFNEIATPAPRGHVPQMDGKRTGEKGGGYMLMKPLVEAAEKLGVRAEYDMRVQTLITDDTGRVVGIIAKQYGKEVAVRARRGVVLATGSFAYNDKMIQAYAPRLIGRPGAAIEEHDGRSILMAQALGADLAHMDATEVAFVCDPQLIVRGILVNGRGQRYVPEDTYSGRIGQMTLFHQDNQAFLVIDEAAYDEGVAATTATPFLRVQPKWVAETVEELESDMGLAEGALRSTVEVYNKHAADGVDPLLHKKSEWVKPIGSPSPHSTCAGSRWASLWAGCGPPSTPRYYTSPGSLFPDSSQRAAARRVCARADTPAGPRSATAASTVAGRAWPPRSRASRAPARSRRPRNGRAACSAPRRESCADARPRRGRPPRALGRRTAPR